MAERDERDKEQGESGKEQSEPCPPLATLLDCGVATDATAQLSLGLAGGEVVGVRMTRGELAHLVLQVLRALQLLGDAGAEGARETYADALWEQVLREKQRERGEESEGGGSGGGGGGGGGPSEALSLPPSELASGRKRHEIEIQRAEKKRRRQRPFSRASGFFLKVRFDGEANHRRIAILGGWHADVSAYNRHRPVPVMRKILRLRWKVLLNPKSGKGTFRDFFVEMPAGDQEGSADPKQLRFLGDHIEGVRPTTEHLRAIENLCVGDQPLALAEIRLTPWRLVDVLDQIRYVTYRAGCAASDWEKRR